MIIKVPGLNRKESAGGGSTFIRNFEKAMMKFGHRLVSEDEQNFDFLLIPGATLAERSVVEEARKRGKGIVLRVDNILEDSRNRSTGMSRLLDFVKLCDVVVYQSEWAKRIMKPYCGEGVVIHNGVDTDIFYPKQKEKTNETRIFYGKYSRGDGKNFNVVQYFCRELQIQRVDFTLVLAGKFADEYQKISHPFEFHNGENYEFHGVQSPEGIAEIMRGCDVALLPYFADACPNMVLEAQACGLPVIFDPYGGTAEIVQFGYPLVWTERGAWDVVKNALSNNLENREMKSILGLQEMGWNYNGIFQLLSQETHNI